MGKKKIILQKLNSIWMKILNNIVGELNWIEFEIYIELNLFQIL
jgi:hypothetical protein